MPETSNDGRHSRPGPADVAGVAALRAALRESDPQKVRALIEAGADI